MQASVLVEFVYISVTIAALYVTSVLAHIMVITMHFCHKF